MKDPQQTLAAGERAPLAIEAEGLVKKYGGRPVLSVERFEVREGEVLAVLGPNGAGKTTLFRLLALLEQPDSGWIKYAGVPVDVRSLEARRRTAAVFQRPVLFQGSVEDNVALGLRFRRLSSRAAKDKVRSVLELLGVSDLASRDVRSLSGGELQRVALARALAVDPAVLFLDEPTSSLDVHVRRRFREDIRRVTQELGLTVVIITHDHNEALALAHRVAVMHEGRVAQVGTPDEVFLSPATPFVADFTGAETIWRGRVVSCLREICVIRTSDGVMLEAPGELSLGEEAVVVIRPEDVALSLLDGGPGRSGDLADNSDSLGLHAFASGALTPRAGDVLTPRAGDALTPRAGGAGASSVRNRWKGVVDSVAPAGPLVRVVVRLDGSEGGAQASCQARFGGEGEVISLITRASAEELGIAPGKRVMASVKAAALHVIAGRHA